MYHYRQTTSFQLISQALCFCLLLQGSGIAQAYNAPVTDGKLATFDLTLLNGLHELELTATDFNGQQVTESIAVAAEGQMKIGHFTLSFVDLAVPVSGLDIEIIRTYGSRDKQLRDFGVGWSLDIRQGSYRNNRKPGEGWQLQNGFQPCDTVLESKSHLTVVRLSDQEVYRFALKLFGGTSTGGGCFATARFGYIDGPLPGTTLEIMGNDQVFYENGRDRVIDMLQSYQYTLGPAGNRTRIDEHDGTSRHYSYDDLYRLTQDRVIDPAAALVYQRDFSYDPVGTFLLEEYQVLRNLLYMAMKGLL